MQIEVKESVDARKERIDAGQAWAMLKTATCVTIAKGKTFRQFSPDTDDQGAIMKQAMGPSGNLRAPTCRVGCVYIIGFNVDLYSDWLKLPS